MASIALSERLLRLERGPWARPLVVFIASGLTVGILGINEVGYQRSQAVLAERESSIAWRTEVSRLQRTMLAAEASQRGYLLTGRAEYREPYDAAVIDFQEALKHISGPLGEGADRRREARHLDELARQKMSEVATTLALFDQGKVDAWRSLLMTDIGREKMAQMDALVQSINARETQRLAASQRVLDATLYYSRLGIAALVFLGVAALLTLIRQARQHTRDRLAQAAALQAERDRLEAEVERRTQELRQIATHLQTAREDERSHLARELHDELGGLLTAAKLDVARMRSKLAAAPPEFGERIAQLVTKLDAGIALKRRIIEDLRPSSLTNLGLTTALEILCREFGERSEIAVHTEIEPGELDPAAQLTVYRLVQEALTNVAKYAKATQVDLRVAAVADGTVIELRDNGIGFDPKKVPPRAHGLAGMRFRVQSGAGRLSIRSAPGSGTVIEAWLPVSTAAPAGD